MSNAQLARDLIVNINEAKARSSLSKILLERRIAEQECVIAEQAKRIADLEQVIKSLDGQLQGLQACAIVKEDEIQACTIVKEDEISGWT